MLKKILKKCSLLLLYSTPFPFKLRGVHRWSKCFPLVLSFQAFNSSIICIGFVHKSRTVRCVGTCAHMKRFVVSCTCVLQRGQSGDKLCEASTWCTYDRRNGDLIILSLARVRRCALLIVMQLMCWLKMLLLGLAY